MTTTPDRISYSFGFTVPGKEQYSVSRVDLSYETTIRDGESAETALARAKAFVLKETLGRPVPPPPATDSPMREDASARRFVADDEVYYDSDRPHHIRALDSAMDEKKVNSPKMRASIRKRAAEVEPRPKIDELPEFIGWCFRQLEADKAAKAGKSRWSN